MQAAHPKTATALYVMATINDEQQTDATKSLMIDRDDQQSI